MFPSAKEAEWLRRSHERGSRPGAPAGPRRPGRADGPTDTRDLISSSRRISDGVRSAPALGIHAGQA